MEIEAFSERLGKNIVNSNETRRKEQQTQRC